MKRPRAIVWFTGVDRSCYHAGKLEEPVAKECDPSGIRFNLRLAAVVEVVALRAA